MSARRPARLLVGAVAAACAASLLAGCSNGSTVAAKRPHQGTATASPLGNGVQQVTITTGNDLRFHPSTVVVHPGRVRIVLRNTAKVGSGPPHNLRVPNLPGAPGTATISAGQSAHWEFVAPAPGRYRFVCTIHVSQGQTGTLIVKAG